MKKILLSLLFLPTIFWAQEDTINPRKNEVRVDIVAAMVSSKYSVSYERFLKNYFSVGINANVSNGKKLERDFDEGNISNLSQYELNPYVRYALSRSKYHYYFVELFGSLNGGEYKEIIYLVDANQNGYYTTQKSKYTDVAAGASVGYKMYFSDKFAFELLVGYGYNLINPDKSPDKISRVGINLGYRF